MDTRELCGLFVLKNVDTTAHHGDNDGRGVKRTGRLLKPPPRPSHHAENANPFKGYEGHQAFPHARSTVSLGPALK